MRYSQNIKDEITNSIEKYKKKNNHDSYLDAIEAYLKEPIIQEKFNFLSYATLSDFLTDEIKDKIFVDASDNNLIEKRFQRKRVKL